MLFYVIFVACFCLIQVQATNNGDPRIIIVGCGVSGIAAATRLLQNGFNNITIIEAENRIGGRVYSREFGGYIVDVGGQWVHGEVDNVSYELAWPLGLIEHSVTSGPPELYWSSGPAISKDTSDKLFEFNANFTYESIPAESLDRSIGEAFMLRMAKFYEEHPEITPEQKKSLEMMLDLDMMSGFAGETWYNVSAHQEYVTCKGDQMMNWKERAYGTILDILMKKYPDPSQELPVVNNTVLNAEVSKINYNVSEGTARVVIANGDEYSADHVITTTSVGVLKADHETMFDPPLPEKKINAIKSIGLGMVTKLYLAYDTPWWSEKGDNPFFYFAWTEEDRKQYENDPEKSWMLGIGSMNGVEHKPNLMLAWVTGPYAKVVESIPEDVVLRQTKEFLQRFLGGSHNLTEPTAILRSQWYTNKHFRGTWSVRTLESIRLGGKAGDLAEPITAYGYPLVMFAGEASHPKYYSTVHGAIQSGWREADRLIKMYREEKPTTEASQAL